MMRACSARFAVGETSDDSRVLLTPLHEYESALSSEVLELSSSVATSLSRFSALLIIFPDVLALWITSHSVLRLSLKELYRLMTWLLYSP